MKAWRISGECVAVEMNGKLWFVFMLDDAGKDLVWRWDESWTLPKEAVPIAI